MDNNPAGIHPIPEIGFSEILGLIEVLKSKGGREDIYKLAAELKMEFGRTLAVIRAAELIKLVHTPGGDVVLEPIGEKIGKARIQKRKELIREELKKLPLIRRVFEVLESKNPGETERKDLQEQLAQWFPNEDAEKAFDNLVNWGRYADLFSYNDDTQILELADHVKK